MNEFYILNKLNYLSVINVQQYIIQLTSTLSYTNFIIEKYFPFQAVIEINYRNKFESL